jgi:drug/metabolite transporter (DMT)-like permease
MLAAGQQQFGLSEGDARVRTTQVMAMLLGWLLFERRFGARQLAALAVSYAGVLLVFGHELKSEGPDVALGALLVFASAVSYALYLVYSGEVVKRLGSLRLTGLATSVACVLCIAQFVLLRPLAAATTVAPEVVWLSLLNATACTFAPVLMVMMAIERIGPTLAAQTGMIGPVSTILMGVVILGEPFTAWIAAGSALVIAGVWLLTRWR